MDTRATLKGASDSLRTPEPLARRAVMRSLLGLGMLGLAPGMLAGCGGGSDGGGGSSGSGAQSVAGTQNGGTQQYHLSIHSSGGVDLGLAFDWSEPRLPGDSIGITSSAQVRPGQAYAFKALPNNARLWLQLNGQSIPDSGTLDLNLTPGFDNTLFAYVAIMPGDPAPDFSGTDTNGQLHSLGALRGKWVLVTFGDWGCAGSRQFAPVLASLYSQYHSLGLEALSVLLCPNSEARLANPTDLSDWTQTYGANYPVISDANNATQYYNREYLSCTYYSCSDQPSIFLIDPQGNITRRYRGWDANDGLATVLAGLQF